MISSDSSSNLESTDGPSSFDTSSSKDTVFKVRGKKAKAKPSFSSISKAKAYLLTKTSMSSFSKAKAYLSSPQTLFVKSFIPIKYYLLRLANGKTCDAILNKTFGVKIPTAKTGAKQKKGKRKIGDGS
ncbi:hypothetical protein Tco_1536283 [Tanacetum coccineum]